jgi:hypothetical protein
MMLQKSIPKVGVPWKCLPHIDVYPTSHPRWKANGESSVVEKEQQQLRVTGPKMVCVHTLSNLPILQSRQSEASTTTSKPTKVYELSGWFHTIAIQLVPSFHFGPLFRRWSHAIHGTVQEYFPLVVCFFLHMGVAIGAALFPQTPAFGASPLVIQPFTVTALKIYITHKNRCSKTTYSRLWNRRQSIWIMNLRLVSMSASIFGLDGVWQMLQRLWMSHLWKHQQNRPWQPLTSHPSKLQKKRHGELWFIWPELFLSFKCDFFNVYWASASASAVHRVRNEGNGWYDGSDEGLNGVQM